MQAGTEGEMLLRVVARLCAELGCPEADEVDSGPLALSEEGVMLKTLSAEDESLVAGLREALARIAAGLSADGEQQPPLALRAALDGAELMMRGELARGHRERLARLLPSFVFLVALPIVDQDRALELSKRVTELIEQVDA